MAVSWTRARRSWLAIIVGTALSSCSTSGYNTGPGSTTGSTGTNTNTTTSTSNAISVGDNVFDPSATAVPVGTTVTWTWIGSVGHNVTFDDGAHSATQATGSYARTFTVAGTYRYHCTIHGTAMSGSVTVQ